MPLHSDLIEDDKRLDPEELIKRVSETTTPERASFEQTDVEVEEFTRRIDQHEYSALNGSRPKNTHFKIEGIMALLKSSVDDIFCSVGGQYRGEIQQMVIYEQIRYSSMDVPKHGAGKSVVGV